MSDDSYVAVFQGAFDLIAESVAENSGFQIATINIVREDDDHFEIVALAGHDAARAALLGRREPIAHLEQLLAGSEPRGLFRFAPAGSHALGIIDDVYTDWMTEEESRKPTTPGAWDPDDLIVAPFYDDEGELRGFLNIDMPRDGRRPTDETWKGLQQYAEAAGNAIMMAHARARATEGFELASAAREVVRRIGPSDSGDGLTQDVLPGIAKMLGARGITMHTLDSTELLTAGDQPMGGARSPLIETGMATACRLWDLDRTLTIGAGMSEQTAEQLKSIPGADALLNDTATGRLLVAPIGFGSECLGCLVLTRRTADPPWNRMEKHEVLALGKDLGRAIFSQRLMRRQSEHLEQLRELDRYKTRMMSTVAHELRTPLTALVGNAEMLGDLLADEVSDPAVQRRLAAVFSAARRMQRMIDDLLTLSRVSRPTQVVRQAPIDVGDALRRTHDLLRSHAEQRNVALELRLPDEPAVILGDADMLEKAATNVAGNALKYTPAGGSVVIEVAGDDDSVSIAVRDTGIGIAPQDVEAVFEEFNRGTNPLALERPGTGLGLAIVKRVVDQHNGHITVESAVGEGTTFTVTIPRAQQCEPSAD